MKLKLQLFAIVLLVLQCFTNLSYAQNNATNSAKEEITLLRDRLIQTLKAEDWSSLKKITDSCKNIIYEKNIFFGRDEKSILLLLTGLWPDALKEKWSISDVAFYDTDSKNKSKLFPKKRPVFDSLNFWLRNAFSKRYSFIINQILSDSSLSTVDKDFLFTKAAAFNVLASNNKKEPLKTLDKSLLIFKKKYQQGEYKEGISYFKNISKRLKMGAFFGGGFSIGKLNNGIQNIFTTPVNYHLNFDLYTNRIGWYVSYSITSSGLKNKTDTLFNQTLWPKGTNNFISDAQAGLGLVVLKSDYARCIFKVGFGSFSMQPVKKAEYSEQVRKIKLKQFPYLNAGACIDFANFKIRYSNKKNKVPLGLRIFYQYNFLSFKNKYPGFATNFQNYGVQLGLAL